MNCAFLRDNKCVNLTIRGEKCVGSKCKKKKSGTTSVAVETPTVTATTVISVVEDTVDTIDVTEAVECDVTAEPTAEGVVDALEPEKEEKKPSWKW